MVFINPEHVISVVAESFLDDATMYMSTNYFRGMSSGCARHLVSFGASGYYNFKGDVGRQRLDVAIPSGLGDWVRFPPFVRACCDWLSPIYEFQDKEYANWHRYPDGELCWIKPISWINYCRPVSVVTDVKSLVGQMFKDVGYLLNCHVVAYVYKLKQWNPSWDAETHGY